MRQIRSVVIPVQPAAELHSAGDVVGVLLDLGGLRAGKQGITIESLALVDLAKQSAAISLLLFSANITEPAAGAAADLDDTEMITYFLGAIPIAAADYVALADSSAATVRNIGLNIRGGLNGLFGLLVTSGTPTYASVLDMTLTVNAFVEDEGS